MLEGLKPINTYLVLTHCDKSMPDSKFIARKVKSFEEYGEIIIPQENVVLFDFSMESLEEFVENIVPGNINLKESADEILENID